MAVRALKKCCLVSSRFQAVLWPVVLFLHSADVKESKISLRISCLGQQCFGGSWYMGVFTALEIVTGVNWNATFY